jgi:DNA invertase Pin-like site-specific DNA recombinase
MTLVQSESIATYLRVSTDDQEIKTQQLFVERLMLTHGLLWEHTQHFEDEGVSAFKYSSLDDRDGGHELMELIRSGTINKLFVYRLDRLFRNSEAGMGFVKVLKQYNVELYSTDFHSCLSTAEGQFQYGLQMLLSEKESGVLSERTTGGMQRTMNELKPISKIPPYGWNYLENDEGEKTVRPNWREQAVINWVHEQTESNKKVADKLNARGVPAKQGGKWSAASLWRMQNQPPKYQSQLARFEEPKRMIQYPFRALQVSVF